MPDWNTRTSMSHDRAALVVERVTWEDRVNNLDYKAEEIATFEIRWNDDNTEVMVVKYGPTGGEGEVIYSEILSPEGD